MVVAQSMDAAKLSVRGFVWYTTHGMSPVSVCELQREHGSTGGFVCVARGEGEDTKENIFVTEGVDSPECETTTE